VLRVITDQPAVEFPPVDFWHSLHYFNLYRLTLASFFVFLAGAFPTSLALDPDNWMTFFIASLLYATVAAFSFFPLKLHWPRFNLQLSGQIVTDIIALNAISYINEAMRSSVGLLLMVSLAAAGLISRGKITLFFAALASIAALLEHTYEIMQGDADMSQYAHVGLLCMAYFAVAWLAHTLAKYAVDSQQLAQRRGRDLVSLSEANRLVMRGMQDGVLVIDGEGAIMQMNARAEQLLRKSIPAKSPLSVAFPILFGQYAQWKQSGNTSRNTVQLDVGLQARLRFVPIERDAANGAVIFLEDMQRVRAEAQQIKLAALGRLTANIAHEVRNPLSAISYATELLQEEPGDARHQRLLQIVLDNTQRINQIVQDVMQLNRRDRAQPEVFDLALMLRTFLDEFNSAERYKPGVIVMTELVRGEVSFDRDHLRQVLWNLCRNALRYGSTLSGSVILTTRTEEGRVMLTVEDDGPGISAEHQGKLFEPFFTTASDGTGLGLYIAKELCEANGALLEYQAGKALSGACFCITFGYLRRDGERHGHGE
jgi:two-component system sensor histidine kinase PilS (NtrC family)